MVANCLRTSNRASVEGLEQSLSKLSLQRKAKSQETTLLTTLVTIPMIYPIDTLISDETDEELVTIS